MKLLSATLSWGQKFHRVHWALEYSSPILLAELESVFQKTNTTRKLAMLLHEFRFYCTFCILQ